MKYFTKSALIALLFFCATTVSQASHGSTGPKVIGKLVASGNFAGKYEGTFKSAFFNEIYLTIYPNGYVSGYFGGDNSVGAGFSGTVNKTGSLSGSFSFRGKDYKVIGQAIKNTKSVVVVVQPKRGGTVLGVANVKLDSSDYAPATGSRSYFSIRVYGNGLSTYLYFYNNGDFEDDGSGTYSIVKVHKNVARITLNYSGGDSQTFLVFYTGYNSGVVYNYSSGKFYYFYGNSEG